MWDAIVKRENLRPIPYEQIVAWGYGDFAFRQDFDNVSSTIKVRQAGFTTASIAKRCFPKSTKTSGR